MKFKILKFTNLNLKIKAFKHLNIWNWEKFRVPSFFEWIFPKWSRQAESTPFWKWVILSEHKMRAPEKNVPCKRCFLLWKSPFSDASPPTVQDRKFYGPDCKFYGLDCKCYGPDRKFYGPDPISAARNSLCRYNRISPSRNSLCRENRIRGARAARMAGCAE